MRIKALTIPLLCLLVATLFLGVQNNIGKMTVFAAGTPDSYGQRILGVWVAEWNATLADYQIPYGTCKDAWTYNGGNTFDGLNILSSTVGITLHEYISSFSIRVYDSLKLKLFVKVAANQTIIVSPSTETRVKLNITGVIGPNQLMTYYSYATGANFYLCTFYWIWDVPGQPVAGQTYNVAIAFETYY